MILHLIETDESTRVRWRVAIFSYIQKFTTETKETSKCDTEQQQQQQQHAKNPP